MFLVPHLAPQLVPYLGGASQAERTPGRTKRRKAALPPAVSIIKATQADFTEMVTVSGSLVPRDEILVAPEVEGFRVLELKVDEGDRVKKGDVLAILVQESLDAQLAQKDADAGAVGGGNLAIGKPDRRHDGQTRRGPSQLRARQAAEEFRLSFRHARSTSARPRPRAPRRNLPRRAAA